MLARIIPTRRLAGLTVLALGLGLIGYLLVLNARIGRRLGGDTAHGHSRFFAAPLRIAPGMDVDRAGVLERLRRLEYQQDDGLTVPGTWRRRRSALEIRL